jgi:carbon-monoxide dehydrogenase medium subunit
MLVKMKSGEIRPRHIVSLLEIQGMDQIDFSGKNKIIGACCTASMISKSSEIRTLFPALAAAAGQIGSPAVRNLGTIGGNAVTASPAADLPPALIAYGARARLRRQEHERVVPLEHFFKGPGTTHIKHDEILVDFSFAHPPVGSAAEFFKIGHRRALQCSTVNGACYIFINPDRHEIEDARIVLGAVGPTVVRALSAEKVLIGEKPTSGLFLRAGEAAASDCNPIDDLRGSAVYRRDMVRVLTSRALQEASKKICHAPVRT